MGLGCVIVNYMCHHCNESAEIPTNLQAYEIEPIIQWLAYHQHSIRIKLSQFWFFTESVPTFEFLVHCSKDMAHFFCIGHFSSCCVHLFLIFFLLCKPGVITKSSNIVTKSCKNYADQNLIRDNAVRYQIPDLENVFME